MGIRGRGGDRKSEQQWVGAMDFFSWLLQTPLAGQIHCCHPQPPPCLRPSWAASLETAFSHHAIREPEDCFSQGVARAGRDHAEPRIPMHPLAGPVGSQLCFLSMVQPGLVDVAGSRGSGASRMSPEFNVKGPIS